MVMIAHKRVLCATQLTSVRAQQCSQVHVYKFHRKVRFQTPTDRELHVFVRRQLLNPRVKLDSAGRGRHGMEPGWGAIVYGSILY